MDGDALSRDPVGRDIFPDFNTVRAGDPNALFLKLL
jgi:hypothetical protein